GLTYEVVTECGIKCVGLWVQIDQGLPDGIDQALWNLVAGRSSGLGPIRAGRKRIAAGVAHEGGRRAAGRGRHVEIRKQVCIWQSQRIVGEIAVPLRQRGNQTGERNTVPLILLLEIREEE